MNKVLMVAFHFPPFMGGSGVLRTLKFCRYLPKAGWRPIVLTPHSRVYPNQDVGQLKQIPSEVSVCQAFSLDSKMHLSLFGWYPRIFSLPDRWATWWIGAVWKGLQIIKYHKPRLIWSTYPIATAHLIGLTLHRLSGIPWVVDFRDSMTEERYPPDPITRKSFRWIEEKTMRRSAKVLFTTPSTQVLYLRRYPWRKPESTMVIENGFDEEDFKNLSLEISPTSDKKFKIRLLHAGVIYPKERDPRPFFRALSRLKKNGSLTREKIQIDLRAPGSEEQYKKWIKENDIQDLVHLLPLLSYQDSLKDAVSSDALLLLQGSTCNHQIPAKVYEYLRLSRPILALTDTQGDTASVLMHCGGATILNISNEEEIFQGIPLFWEQVKKQIHPLPSIEKVHSFSRQTQATQLAQIFNEVNAEH